MSEDSALSVPERARSKGKRKKGKNYIMNKGERGKMRSLVVRVYNAIVIAQDKSAGRREAAGSSSQRAWKGARIKKVREEKT